MTEALQILFTVFSLESLGSMLIGVTAGIIIGALPGLSIIMAIIVLLPFTYDMNSISAMYLLLGAYCGGTFGGSISAILLNTPGTGVAVATTFDGYPMAKKGKAADALKVTLTASTFGGIFSAFALLFLAPLIAKVAFVFGPAEYFALTVFGLSMVANVSNGNLFKGLIAATVGMLVTVIGADPIENVPRFVFGEIQLFSGINTTVCMLGVFALSEMLLLSQKKENKKEAIAVGKSTLSIREILKHSKLMAICSAIGLYIGAIPGSGGDIGAYMCYDTAKKLSKHPEEFGHGAIEGVIAPESGNNATTGSALIPMLTLGIPGSAAVGVLMNALSVHNITPGPDLFTNDKFWVYSIMFGLIVINILMFILGNGLTKFFVKINKVPQKVLVPCILVLCMLGGYSIKTSFFDLNLIPIFIVLGYFMKKIKMPISPMALGIVLGKLAETNFRRALILSDGSMSIFITRPISAFILAFTVYSIVSPHVKEYFKNKQAKTN